MDELFRQNAFGIGLGLAALYASLMGFLLAASSIVAGYIKSPELAWLKNNPDYKSLLVQLPVSSYLLQMP